MLFPLNFHVMLDPGKLDTTQVKFTVSPLLTSAEETPMIRGASAKFKIKKRKTKTKHKHRCNALNKFEIQNSPSPCSCLM